MTQTFLSAPTCFLKKPGKAQIDILCLTEDGFKSWIKKMPAPVKTLCAESGFKGQPGKVLFLNSDKAQPKTLLLGVRAPLGIYDAAHAVQAVQTKFAGDFINRASFSLLSRGMKAAEITLFHQGWALGCYAFTAYRKPKHEAPKLVWSKNADQARVTAFSEGIALLRDLINTPANALGPAEIEAAAKALAARHRASVATIKGKALESGFPLIHAVGAASPRAPRLIDLRWGKAKDPKLTLVGKGVCFDTGGLNLKPGNYMALMKKDMGGAAHVLALAHLIMALKIPVQLRVLIPAVENAVGGAAFRPGDVFRSRKGLTVENTNTDAEGRLILGDSLTYACEDPPNLLIDFATLTGSARAALGPDIPAVFTNSEALRPMLEKAAKTVDDPLWVMPLWQPYRKHLKSSIADMVNSSGTPGDLIYSALFLESFVAEKTDWIHLDCYAWEQTGIPGRPVGGAETGLRAVFAMIETRYGR